jgi:hypothetical protein
MKGFRKLHQRSTDKKEKEPRHQDSHRELSYALQPEKSAAFHRICRALALETCRAQDAIIVFSHALTAEKPGAIRTARNGLAKYMVETTLMRDAVHSDQERFKGLVVAEAR